jgi:hypothetical protein
VKHRAAAVSVPVPVSLSGTGPYAAGPPCAVPTKLRPQLASSARTSTRWAYVAQPRAERERYRLGARESRRRSRAAFAKRAHHRMCVPRQRCHPGMQQRLLSTTCRTKCYWPEIVSVRPRRRAPLRWATAQRLPWQAQCDDWAAKA